jgi:hypothetical protein
MTKPGYLLVYVILLCALANGVSEGKRWKHQDFYRYYLRNKVFHIHSFIHLFY